MWMTYVNDRYDWGAEQGGASIGLLGITSIAALTLLKFPIQWWGERRMLYITLITHTVSQLMFGLAWIGWMMYAVILLSFLGYTFNPILRGVMVREVPDNQFGMLQGALASLGALAAIIGPSLLIIHSFFLSDMAPFRFQGAAFIVAFLLDMGSLYALHRAMKIGASPLRSSMDNDSSVELLQNDVGERTFVKLPSGLFLSNERATHTIAESFSMETLADEDAHDSPSDSAAGGQFSIGGSEQGIDGANDGRDPISAAGRG